MRGDLRTTDQCARPLASQVADRTGAVRRADHPPQAVHRLDLLSDDDLERYRTRFPQLSAEALQAYDLLTVAMEERVAAVEEAARVALEGRIRERPILGVFVCTSCGAFEVARSTRRWDIDRAMRRSGMNERELLAVALLIAECWIEVAEPPPTLDAITTEMLHELHALVGQDVDHATVRARCGGSDR